MNKSPKVSIILPTFNRSGYIKKAIDSVLNQTYTDFELIVVDDASTDETREIINEYQKKDSRIKYIVHSKRKGGAAARNTGIRIAKGNFIAFQDSDDEWLTQKLEKQMKLFEDHPHIDAIFTKFKLIKNDREVIIPDKHIEVIDKNILKKLLKMNFIDAPTLLLKKECFSKVGLFDENLPRLQDWDFAIRLAKKCKIMYIDEILLHAYDTPGNISSNYKELIFSVEKIINKYIEDFENYKFALAGWYYLLAEGYNSLENKKKGIKYFLKAIKTHPMYLLKPFYKIALNLLKTNDKALDD